MMKKIMTVLLVLLLVSACGVEKVEKEFTVGVLQWGEHVALNESYEGMVQGLQDAGMSERVSVIRKNANDDPSIANQIISQFVADKVNVIYAIATPAAQSAINMIDGTDIKVVFSAVTDPVVAGLLDNPQAPEGNVTGVSDAVSVEDQMNLMRAINPDLKSVGVLFNTSEANSGLQVKEMKAVGALHNVEIHDIGVSSANEIEMAAQQAASQSDALFIITDNLITTAVGILVDKATQHQIPVYMAEDAGIEHGVMASDSISYFKLGVQAGDMVSNLLTGTKTVSQIPVEVSKETNLIINKVMVEKLGITIPTEILERAELR